MAGLPVSLRHDRRLTSMPTVKTSDRWKWLVVNVEGDDLVVRHVRGTCFGSGDKLDNGVGSAGWPVGKRTDVPVVALPYRVAGHAQFKDSPIPAGMPVKTKDRDGITVRVFCPGTGKWVDAQLADLGPSLTYRGKYLFKGIDLSKATCDGLGVKYDPDDGEYIVDFRIVGGARYLSPEMRP